MTPLDARDFLTEIYLNELINTDELAPVREAFKLAIKSLEITNNDLRYENTEHHKKGTNLSVINNIEKPQTKLERVVEYLIKSGAKFSGRSSFLMNKNIYFIKDKQLYLYYGYCKEEQASRYTIDDILEGWFQIQFKDKWLKVKKVKPEIKEPEHQTEPKYILKYHLM